jgi:basic membrane protein A
MKRTLKLLCLTLALTLCTSLLAACGAVSTAASSAAASASASASAGSSAAADRSTVSKIAVLLPGSITDQSWNQTAYEGLMKIKDMGYEVAYTENVGSNDMESVFRSYCEDGYDFIIGHGAQYGDACCRVAADYPNVNFFITGNAPEDIDAKALPANIMFADYRECEGAYVSGAMAALMTKSGKIGYVGGGNNTTQQSDKNAFIEGAASVNPKVEVKTVITGTFDDSALGKETAIAMIEDGVDVILQTCDHTGLGVLEACNDKNVYCIGYTTDQSSLVAPGLCLTSMMVDIPFMISSQIDLIKAGGYGGQSFPGLHDGVVSMADFSSAVPADVAEKVNAIIGQIKDGSLVITPNYSETESK